MRISKALYETWVCRKFNAVVRCVSCFIIVDDIVRVCADWDVFWRRKAGHISALGAAAGARAVLGVLSLVRGEGRQWLAWTGVMLNGLFALFHLMVVLFAR